MKTFGKSFVGVQIVFVNTCLTVGNWDKRLCFHNSAVHIENSSHKVGEEQTDWKIISK